MAESSPSVIVALDGGTTNTRARLVRDSRVIATARRAVGVRDTVQSEGRRPLVDAVRESLEDVCREVRVDEPELIVAAGMLTSDVGLLTVPHVIAPAGLHELASGAVLRVLPEVSQTPILFVPGVRTPPSSGLDGWTNADIMRGEECETLGALMLREAATGPLAPTTRAFLWPGSHTKLVEVDGQGRLTRSYTTLAGELTDALARHTLLAASLPAELPAEPDLDALDAGARMVAREGLGRAAFLVRIGAVTEALDSHQRASFWIGAALAEDVAHLARHPILEGTESPVWVGGRQPQRSLYARWLAERHRGPVQPLDDPACEHASALGALAVARAYRALQDGRSARDRNG